MQKGVWKVGRGITNGLDVIFMENEEDHRAVDLRLLSGCVIHIQMHPAEPPKLQQQQGIICAFSQSGSAMDLQESGCCFRGEGGEG
jgi:hypothetical protein